MDQTPQKLRAEYSGPYSEEDDLRLARLYKTRATHKAIAEALGRHANNVEYRIKQLQKKGKLSRRNHEKYNTPKNHHLTEADHAWMAYWKKPWAERLRLRNQYFLEQTNEQERLRGVPPRPANQSRPPVPGT